MCPAYRSDHRLIRAHASEQALHQPGRLRDSQVRCEARLELLHGQVAALESAQLRQRLRVLAEGALDRVRWQPLRLAERLERVEDVGGEDAAEVGQQSLHEPGGGCLVISSAALASIGTPLSNSFRYSSSVVPITERL